MRARRGLALSIEYLMLAILSVMVLAVAAMYAVPMLTGADTSLAYTYLTVSYCGRVAVFKNAGDYPARIDHVYLVNITDNGGYIDRMVYVGKVLAPGDTLTLTFDETYDYLQVIYRDFTSRPVKNTCSFNAPVYLGGGDVNLPPEEPPGGYLPPPGSTPEPPPGTIIIPPFPGLPINPGPSPIPEPIPSPPPIIPSPGPSPIPGPPKGPGITPGGGG